MSHYLKAESLRRIEQVAVVCRSCHHSGTLTNHDDTLNYALVCNTYLLELRDELPMLVRAQQLFARFPNSGHYLQDHETRRNRPVRPHFRGDPDFVKALQADPDLSDFLRNKTASYIPGRLQFVRELVQKWENELDFTSLKCPVCASASLTIEPELFERL